MNSASSQRAASPRRPRELTGSPISPSPVSGCSRRRLRQRRRSHPPRNQLRARGPPASTSTPNRSRPPLPRAQRSHRRALPGRQTRTKLPFPDGEFDLVYTSKTTHHVRDWKQALTEMVRVLKPGRPPPLPRLRRLVRRAAPDTERTQPPRRRAATPARTALEFALPLHRRLPSRLSTNRAKLTATRSPVGRERRRSSRVGFRPGTLLQPRSLESVGDLRCPGADRVPVAQGRPASRGRGPRSFRSVTA